MGIATKSKKEKTVVKENKQDVTPSATSNNLKAVKGKMSGDGAKGDRRLLVLSVSETFSEKIVDYSLNMAKRMNCDIVALNTVPLKNECVNRMSAIKDSVCTQFESDSTENAKAFIQRAADMGIKLIHKITFYAPDEATRHIEAEVGKVDLIVTEELETASPKGKGPKNNAGEKEIFVYSLA